MKTKLTMMLLALLSTPALADIPTGGGGGGHGGCNASNLSSSLAGLGVFAVGAAILAIGRKRK
jgi:hypothetical protein